MIKENKNKLRIKTRSKILVLGLILIILVGLFGPMANVSAQTPDTSTPLGICKGLVGNIIDNSDKIPISKDACTSLANGVMTNWTQTTTQDKFNESGGSGQFADFKCNAGVLGTGFFSKGCLAELTYNIWVVSAKVAKLGGLFLDYFIYYSTNSTSYSNTFINKGWGAVRDVANIFFIVTLLYIAIKTVLSLDSHGSKKMISYVVIIALVINFSLFTTKVVIDASNILAKIFYNNITSVDANNKPLDAKAGGEKSISVGLISKFDPQVILKPGSSNYDEWTFIFITLFLLVITLYTAYIFFAIAVLFVARVVSLWIAMIFSPLAFISYAVPFDVPFGHKEWWDDLLKNAFLAPIFIFFLYIIVLFTDFLKTLVAYPEGTDVFQHLMSVAIPFAILMMLLMKAKSLVVKYSGKIGEAVMSGAKMVGGLALGVGAGAIALGGRTAVARGAAKLSRTEGAIDYGKARVQYNKDLADYEHKKKEEKKTGISAGPAPTWATTKATYEEKNKVKINEGIASILGGRINAAQSRSGEVDHARHEMDELKKKAGLEGVDDKFLSGVEKGKIEGTFLKENRSTIESDIRRGHDAKNNKIVNSSGEEISQDKYESKHRVEIADKVRDEKAKGDVNDKGELTDQGNKKVENQLRQGFNDMLKDLVTDVSKERFKKLQHEATETVGIPTRIVSRSTSGTYDVRNLPSALKSDKREGFTTKALLGLSLVMATGIRAGFKNIAGVEAAGTPQGNFTKDVGQTISEALKNVKINVDLGGDKKGAQGPKASAHAPDAGHH